MTGQIFGEEPAADDRHAPGVDPTVGVDPAAARLDAGPTRQEPEPQAADSPEAKSDTNPDSAHLGHGSPILRVPACEWKGRTASASNQVGSALSRPLSEKRQANVGNDSVDHRRDSGHLRDCRDVRGKLAYGIILIVVGLLVGPGGVSIFT